MQRMQPVSACLVGQQHQVGLGVGGLHAGRRKIASGWRRQSVRGCAPGGGWANLWQYHAPQQRGALPSQHTFPTGKGMLGPGLESRRASRVDQEIRNSRR